MRCRLGRYIDELRVAARVHDTARSQKRCAVRFVATTARGDLFDAVFPKGRADSTGRYALGNSSCDRLTAAARKEGDNHLYNIALRVCSRARPMRTLSVSFGRLHARLTILTVQGRG
eukprot:5568723-Pleurochrysis_carterae.AAC.1